MRLFLLAKENSLNRSGILISFNIVFVSLKHGLWLNTSVLTDCFIKRYQRDFRKEELHSLYILLPEITPKAE